MSERITNQDLDIMLERYANACGELGLLADGDMVRLQHGSKVNGIAYRVHTAKGAQSGDWHPPAGQDFLGFTKREAYDLLADRSRVLEDVAFAQEKVAR